MANEDPTTSNTPEAPNSPENVVTSAQDATSGDLDVNAAEVAGTKDGNAFAAAQELPGVAATTETKGSKWTLTHTLLAVIAVLLLVLVGTLVVVNRGGDDSKGEAKPSATSSKSASARGAKSSDSEDEKIAAAEAAAAKKLGLKSDEYAPTQAATGRQAIAAIENHAADSGRSLGPADAKVVVHLFSDFSCPMCTKLHEESIPELEKMAKAGDIRIEWHNFVIFADHGSDKAARGALAAAKQGKMFEFIDAVYNELGTTTGHATYTDENVRGIAEGLKLNMSDFDAAYASQEIIDEVNAETTYASQTLGLTGTPALLVGNAYMSGAYPLDIIKNTIEVQTELAG